MKGSALYERFLVFFLSWGERKRVLTNNTFNEFPVFVETRDVIGVYHGRLVDFLEGRTHVGVREENLVVDGVHWDIYR